MTHGCSARLPWELRGVQLQVPPLPVLVDLQSGAGVEAGRGSAGEGRPPNRGTEQGGGAELTAPPLVGPSHWMLTLELYLSDGTITSGLMCFILLELLTNCAQDII